MKKKIKINEYIEHTNLKADAREEDIIRLCKEAKEYNFKGVCVNPYFVSLCKEELKGTKILVSSVIGFPLGASTSLTKAYETEDAYKNACDEFDMVINIGKLKDKDYDYVEEDIRAVVKAAKEKIVKVIIETGLLSEEEKVLACQIATRAGADFVKTCTGMNKGQAEIADILLMRNHIDKKMEIKASGGIKTYKEALDMVLAGASRIGTSRGIEIVKGLRTI